MKKISPFEKTVFPVEARLKEIRSNLERRRHNTIDCDAPPSFKPLARFTGYDESWARLPGYVGAPKEDYAKKTYGVADHRENGQWPFNPGEIKLILLDAGDAKAKKRRKGLNAYWRYEMLGDAELLNANVLDYLLEHPELIPEDWKGKQIIFLGTTFINNKGKHRWVDSIRFVRFLYWDDIKNEWEDGVKMYDEDPEREVSALGTDGFGSHTYSGGTIPGKIYVATLKNPSSIQISPASQKE